ncbi:MAG TPA: hypothetical protein VE954_15595 [Oligoflexus sp.]|uniref:hypothetical protein n=1 Tax=Oligoflexus sp. TaxID=1971216 RepID=UPI002D3C56AE|nr:hypothetical protein [Oligoflexus sp.]HYX34525.1 hypothetical protein [Oligoflexus sp.]
MLFGKVKFLGRSGIIYSEGKRNLSLLSEMLAGDDFDLVIYLSRASHWEDGTPLSAEDKARIQANIAEELKSSRIDWN